MAANSNYYGYSAGVQGSQVYGNTMPNPQMNQSAYSAQNTAAYGAQSTTPSANAYGTASPRQNVMPSQSAYTPTAASSYQTTGLSGSSYGYTARVQDSTSQSYQTNAAAAYTSPTSYYSRDNSQASSGYDASKTSSYYGQQHSGTTQGYGYGSPATKSMYSGYSTPSNTSNQMPSQSGQKPSTTTASNVSYPYKGQASATYNQNSSSYSSPSNWSGSGGGGGGSAGGGGGGYQQTQGYDAAVYNAASSYFQQQTQPRQKWGNNKGNNSGGNNQNSNKSGQQRQRNPPRQQQVHYCDVCKISCAGPQTYKEHLEGQKHKKKEAAQKQMEAVGADGYKCSLCDVTCTGTDAFNAHLKGAKHLKTVKLHEKLGKPIPEVLSAEAQDKDKKKDVKAQPPKPQFRGNQRRNRKPSAPKITFIGGNTLNTSTGETATSTGEASETPDADATAATPEDAEIKKDTPTSEEGKEPKFVGEDYVEEVKSDAGKVIGFECKLCECKFNDTLAREAHLKGRRHQLAYKKKVQPDYVVDQKPSQRNRQPPQPRSLMDDKARRRWEQDMYWRQQEAAWRNEEVRRWGEEEYWRRLEEEERMWEEQESHRHTVDWGHRGPPRPDFLPPDMYPPPNMPRPRQDSQDDRLVMAKHKQIYPNEQELSAVQSIVSAVEKALKLVSDSIAEEEAPPKTEVKEEKMEVTETPAEEKTEADEQTKPDAEGEEKTDETKEEKKPEDTTTAAKPKDKTEQAPPRTLKGVMRVGVLAKGLLLHERLDVQLVVLCQDRPTTQLMERVSTKLPEQLTKVSDEKYDVAVDGCTISVTSTKEPSITVTITLTSPVMRDEADAAQAEEQKDVLDRDKCLEALASLRHAKWFQAKANGVPSCVVIIRILRDMRDRLPVFTPLNSWALELLVEKCLSSADQPLGPGEAFRRVLECIASGIILPGGPGLHDPCEKEVTDASKEMTDQEREELTATAQHYLRLQAFRQLHKVLGIDPLPASSKFRGGRYGRGGRFKRRREDSGQGDGSAKKEKKDGEEDGEGEGEEGKGSEATGEAESSTTTQAPVEDKPTETAAAAEATS